jgi:hypothetical protein
MRKHMRRHEMQRVIDSQNRHIDLLKIERDKARELLNESLMKLHAKADEHAAELAKACGHLSGLAEAVRASLLTHAEADDKPAAKRNGKAAQ